MTCPAVRAVPFHFLSEKCPNATRATECPNIPGSVGDKPIEALGEVGKAALTSGISAVLKQAANAVGISGTSTATGSACTDGSCAVPAAK